MMVFEIKTTKSDYPFLVLAERYTEAVEILQREKNVWDGDIISVRYVDAYKGDHILVKELILAKERLEEKVKQETNGETSYAHENDGEPDNQFADYPWHKFEEEKPAKEGHTVVAVYEDNEWWLVIAYWRDGQFMLDYGKHVETKIGEVYWRYIGLPTIF